jgi:hypothetical protein
LFPFQNVYSSIFLTGDIGSKSVFGRGGVLDDLSLGSLGSLGGHDLGTTKSSSYKTFVYLKGVPALHFLPWLGSKLGIFWLFSFIFSQFTAELQRPANSSLT